MHGPMKAKDLRRQHPRISCVLRPGFFFNNGSEAGWSSFLPQIPCHRGTEHLYGICMAYLSTLFVLAQ